MPGEKAVRKYRQMAITGLGLEPVSYTDSGMPQADANVIRALAGKDPQNGKFGLAYEQFKLKGDEVFGQNISIALNNWLEFKHIEKLLSTYIKPL